MKVVVTGASGLIGSHLCRELLAEGHEVSCLSQSRRLDLPSLRQCQVDIASGGAREFAEQADAIVHLAGLSDASLSYQQPAAYALVNAQGTLNMLEAARRRGAHFILASSQRVYRPQVTPLPEDSPREPVDPYGYSKLVAETWCAMYGRLYGLSVAILRFFSVYGPGQRLTGGSSGVAAIFVRRALAGLDLVVKSRALRDFTYVADVTAGLRLALGHRQSGVFNVASGVGTSILDLADLVREVTGAPCTIREEYGDDEGSYVADISQARATLGYEPRVNLREGLQQYVQWMREAGQDSA